MESNILTALIICYRHSNWSYHCRAIASNFAALVHIGAHTVVSRRIFRTHYIKSWRWGMWFCVRCVSVAGLGITELNSYKGAPTGNNTLKSNGRVGVIMMKTASPGFPKKPPTLISKIDLSNMYSAPDEWPLALVRSKCNLESISTHIKQRNLKHLEWNYHEVNATGNRWWLVTIGVCSSLQPSAN